MYRACHVVCVARAQTVERESLLLALAHSESRTSSKVICLVVMSSWLAVGLCSPMPSKLSFGADKIGPSLTCLIPARSKLLSNNYLALCVINWDDAVVRWCGLPWPISFFHRTSLLALRQAESHARDLCETRDDAPLALRAVVRSDNATFLSSAILGLDAPQDRAGLEGDALRGPECTFHVSGWVHSSRVISPCHKTAYGITKLLFKTAWIMTRTCSKQTYTQFSGN
jgi:hypothetical protein